MPFRFIAAVRHGLIPSFSVAIVNLSALMILGAGVWFFWELMEPMPVRDVRTVKVEPEDHVVDRSKYQALVVHRWADMRGDAELRVIRSWVDSTQTVLPVQDDWVFLEAGAGPRPPVLVYPPAAVQPGYYRYRLVLEWCNTLRCARYHVPDVEVLVKGKPAAPAVIPDLGPRF